MASSSAQPDPSGRPLCKFFLRGECIYGQNCFFLHNQPQDNIPSASSSFTTTRFPHPLSPAPAPPPPIATPAPSSSQQRIYCRYFMEGYCHRGTSCWFLHESPAEEEAGLVIDLENETIKSETTTVTATTVTTTTITAKSKEVATEPDDPEDQDAAEERPCAICLEVPTTFGLLVSCDHIYCLECIREWRKNRVSGMSNSAFSNLDRNGHRPNSPSSSTSSTADLGPTKTCPLCRIPSPYIIPSSVFPATAHDKAIIINRYKSSMSRVPCKYFELSDPSRRSCPFGDECFFRHAEANAPEVRIFASRPSRHGSGRRGHRGGYRGGYRGEYRSSIWRDRYPRFSDWSNPSDETNGEFDIMVAEALNGWAGSSEEELARMLEMMMLGELQAVEEGAMQRGIERAQAQRDAMEEWDGRGDVPTGRWFRMGDWGIYRAPETGRGGRRRGGGGGGGGGAGAMRRSYDVVGREEYEYGRITYDPAMPARSVIESDSGIDVELDEEDEEAITAAYWS